MEETEYVPASIWEVRESTTHLVFQMLILHLQANVPGFSAAALKRDVLAMQDGIAQAMASDPRFRGGAVLSAQMDAWNREIIDAMLPTI